jgi:hypothetical protein
MFGISVSCIEPSGMATQLLTLPQDLLNTLWEETSIDIRNEYGRAWFDKSASVITDLLKVKENPMKVIKEIENALTDEHPKAGYFAGNVAKFVIRPISWLPSSWYENAMTLMLPRIPK